MTLSEQSRQRVTVKSIVVQKNVVIQAVPIAGLPNFLGKAQKWKKPKKVKQSTFLPPRSPKPTLMVVVLTCGTCTSRL